MHEPSIVSALKSVQRHNRVMRTGTIKRTLHACLQWIGWRLLIVASFLGLLTTLTTAIILARPWSSEIDIGGRWDGPYLDGFYGFERNEQGRYRWSTPNGEIYLPGVGEHAALELRVHGGPTGKTLYLNNDTSSNEILLRPGWQLVHLMQPANNVSGDVRFTVMTNAQQDHDRRQLGFVFDTLRIVGRGDAPPIGQALLLGLSVAFGCGLTGWCARRARIGALVGALLLVGAAFILAYANGAWRLYLTDYTGRLALVLSTSLLVALAAEWALRRLDERGVVRLGEAGRRAFVAIIALAFLLRFSALAYPLNFPSDLRFNLSRTWMVRQGKFLELFLPNAGLTPVQWRTDITVPRTPYYYLLMSPLTFLPGNGPELAMMAVSCAIDGLMVGLVGLIALRAGLGRRAALAAAFLAATQAFALVVVTSWGIYTTLLGQCLALLAAFLWLCWQSRLHERRVQFAIASAMLGAFLSHPATLLLFGATWVVLIGLLRVRREPTWRPTLKISLYASLGALLLYYGWHLPELVRRSLPVVFAALGGGRPLNTEAHIEAINGGASVVWPQLIELYGYWLLGGALLGAMLLLNQLFQAARSVRALAVLLLSWTAIYIPFALADARVTLNYKHILFMLPPIMLLTGLLYGKIARYRWGRVVVFALLALVLWQGVDLVIYKVMYAYISLR